ncbi:unnamed protein product, partial [Tilletia controversa]
SELATERKKHGKLQVFAMYKYYSLTAAPGPRVQRSGFWISYSHLPRRHCIDPGPLAAATYAAAAAATAATTKASPGLKAPRIFLSSSSSFSARLNLPFHLGGAGVLGFFTSRYFLILVIVTAVINRIEHTAFLAAVATVLTEALIKNLEGSRAAPYFNLNRFAYLTHAYVFSPDSEHEYPGSPTWSPFFNMFLQLAELWTLSVVSLWKSRPRSQLPITSIFGIALTIHHLHWRYIGSPTDPLHIMNRSPDAFLLAIILLTAFLHALTMAITEGTIDTSRLFFNASNLPSLTEDYNLALFKLGTACLESTRLSGLSRELRRRAGRGTRATMDEDEDIGLAEFSEDERDMIVRHQTERRRRMEGGANEEDVGDGDDNNGDGREVDDARALGARVTALRNGFALEIRDLRTAADGAFARNSLAVLSGTSPTRLAEARRFGLTLLRVIFALTTLSLV